MVPAPSGALTGGRGHLRASLAVSSPSMTIDDILQPNLSLLLLIIISTSQVSHSADVRSLYCRDQPTHSRSGRAQLHVFCPLLLPAAAPLFNVVPLKFNT